MSLSKGTLADLNKHWAVAAISAENLERAENLVHQQFGKQVAGKQINFSFANAAVNEAFLERLAIAFELAAIEELNELCRPASGNRYYRDQAVASLSRALEIRCLLPVPADTLDRLFLYFSSPQLPFAVTVGPS